MGKRPRLAREIGDCVDVDADFLLHLAPNAVLDRFARLDEAGEGTVAPRWKSMRTREQQLASTRDERHHCRRHARIRDVTARRTFLRALARLVPCRRAAATAVTMRAVPFHDLECTCADGEQRFGNAKEQRAQTQQPEIGRCCDRVRQTDRHARHAGKLAQVMPGAVDTGGAELIERGHRRRRIGAGDQQVRIAERKRERRARKHRGERVRRSEALRRMHVV